MSKEIKQTQEKKAYEKPAVIYRQVLETVANACDEAGANGKTGINDLCTVLNS